MELQYEKENPEDQMKIFLAYPLKKKRKGKNAKQIQCRTETDAFIHEKLNYNKDGI